ALQVAERKTFTLGWKSKLLSDTRRRSVQKHIDDPGVSIYTDGSDLLGSKQQDTVGRSIRQLGIFVFRPWKERVGGQKIVIVCPSQKFKRSLVKEASIDLLICFDNLRLHLFCIPDNCHLISFTNQAPRRGAL